MSGARSSVVATNRGSACAVTATPQARMTVMSQQTLTRRVCRCLDMGASLEYGDWCSQWNTRVLLQGTMQYFTCLESWVVLPGETSIRRPGSRHTHPRRPIVLYRGQCHDVLSLRRHRHGRRG